jgi:hypothetical protein
MKKTLLTLSMILTLGLVQAQVILSENFDVAPPTTWTMLNLSTPAGTNPLWFQGNPTDPDPLVSGPFDSFAGAPNSYMGVNFNSVAGNNTISNWIFTPVVSLQNGDIISFYTRTTTPGATTFPDRLQMRIGAAAAANPVGNTGVGGYTTLAVEVNPNLTTTGYPNTWTQYTYTVTGLPSATPSKVAFRYFVTSGGPTGANSDYIGVDTFLINRPLSTADFFTTNFAMHPNPVKDVVNITAKNGASIESVQVIDINGRTVNQTTVGNDTVQINVSNLNSGVYFVKVQSDLGVGTSKIIKN